MIRAAGAWVAAVLLCAGCAGTTSDSGAEPTPSSNPSTAPTATANGGLDPSLASAAESLAASAQAEAPSAIFRRGNEQAAKSRWDDAITEYSRLAKDGVKAPSLYWNWAQAAFLEGPVPADNSGG